MQQPNYYTARSIFQRVIFSRKTKASRRPTDLCDVLADSAQNCQSDPRTQSTICAWNVPIRTTRQVADFKSAIYFSHLFSANVCAWTLRSSEFSCDGFLPIAGLSSAANRPFHSQAQPSGGRLALRSRSGFLRMGGARAAPGVLICLKQFTKLRLSYII